MKNGRWMGLFAALLLCWALPAEAKPKAAKGSTAASAAKAKKPRKARKAKAKKKRKTSTTTSAASSSGATSETRGVARVKQGGDGYSYVFRDDPLAGANNLAGAARIRVRNHGARRTLMRPRLDFVPELLKSVEDI